MWLSNRRTFLFGLAAAALSGCGFAPVYGTKGAGTALLGQVLVDAPTTRDEQLMVRQIETRLGHSSAARYELSYDLSIAEERMAISATNITTRFNLVGQADYLLRDAQSGVVLHQGKANHFTGYSATGTTVATLAAERDARKRLARILADQIVTRLQAASADLTQ